MAVWHPQYQYKQQGVLKPKTEYWTLLHTQPVGHAGYWEAWSEGGKQSKGVPYAPWGLHPLPGGCSPEHLLVVEAETLKQQRSKSLAVGEVRFQYLQTVLGQWKKSASLATLDTVVVSTYQYLQRHLRLRQMHLHLHPGAMKIQVALSQTQSLSS